MVLAGCMHAGSAIFKLQTCSTDLSSSLHEQIMSIDTLLMQPSHRTDKLLTYGVDWFPNWHGTSLKYLHSSFYEKYYQVVST